MEIHTELLNLVKDKPLKSVLKTKLAALLTSISSNYIFYIDASKSDTVDAAYVTNDTQQAFRLSPECSVNTAELYAILRALQSAEAHHESNKSLAICTDSISSILNIQKLYPTNPIMIKIQEEIQKHTNCRKGSTSHLGTSTLRNRRKRTRRSNS
nr:PREDICTED: uncharacterized protein LOC107398294 [Tribolium castaneum]|eukprot:XP_015837412.1 PREDICTED: uncharacterized protein LOC107398294 [Tribolium castaneum]